jgi:hypothetical protein
MHQDVNALVREEGPLDDQMCTVRRGDRIVVRDGLASGVPDGLDDRVGRIRRWFLATDVDANVEASGGLFTRRFGADRHRR